MFSSGRAEAQLRGILSMPDYTRIAYACRLGYSASPPGAHRHDMLGMVLADLAPGVMQEDIVQGGPMHVHAANPHPGPLDQAGHQRLTVLGEDD